METIYNDIDAVAQGHGWQDLWATVINHDSDSCDTGISGYSNYPRIEQNIEAWALSDLLSQDFAFDSTHESSWKIPLASNQAYGISAAEICFGMIDKVSTKLLGNMSALLRQSEQESTYCSNLGFNVTFQNGHFMLLFSDGTPFGQINDRVERGMLDANWSGIRYRGFVSAFIIRQLVGRAKRESDAVISIGLNVYGPKTYFERIGQAFSKNKLYLQDPDHGLEQVEYCNPHLLEYPGFAVPCPRIDMGLADNPTNEERFDIERTMAEVYSSLTRFRDLDSMMGSDLIKTPLLLHQE